MSQFRATYTDITPYARIIYTYDMWLDGVHASTSITTIVLEPSKDRNGSGTRLTFTEQGVHLDGVHGPGPQAAAGRKEGTAGLLYFSSTAILSADCAVPFCSVCVAAPAIRTSSDCARSWSFKYRTTRSRMCSCSCPWA